MGKYDWYPRDGADFIAGTMGMTLEEKGAYSIVLDLLYSNCKEITDDPRYISGVCGCSIRKWKAIREVLISAGKLQSENGKLSNERWRDWMQKNAPKSARNVIETSSKLAPNNLKSHETLSKYPENECETIENKDLFPGAPRAGARTQRLDKIREERSNKEKEEKTPIPPKGDCVSNFDIFFDRFPKKRRGNKSKARSAWNKAINESMATEEEILHGLESYRASDEVSRGYVKGAAAWLNDDGWGKDYAPPAKRSNTGGPSVDEQAAAIEQAIRDGRL